jgi:hypothetical protein
MRGIHALPIGGIALACFAFSCHKVITADMIEKAPDAILLQGPLGTSAWIVKPDGAVSATLKTPDGKPIDQPVTGQVTFAAQDGTPMPVPVQYDAKTGVLTAAGPALAADITPMHYDLSVGGSAWNGAIDIPKGGTQDLVDTSKLQGSFSANVAGPNGGVVEAVGPDRIEVVANKATGDVRAYVLGPDNRPIDPGDRKITLAIDGEAPELLVLVPAPEGHFVMGHIGARIDPPHLTVAVNAHGATHACLVGWAPGSVVVVGPKAPRVHLLAVEAWPGEVIEVHGRHGHVHDEVVVGAPAVVVVGTPGVVVGGGAEVHGGMGWGHEHGHSHEHEH